MGYPYFTVQTMGDKTPPWGVPLVSFLVIFFLLLLVCYTTPYFAVQLTSFNLLVCNHEFRMDNVSISVGMNQSRNDRCSNFDLI
jgi:hypothetical protein